MNKSKLTRTLMSACSAFALSAVMYGCVHSGSSTADKNTAPELTFSGTASIDEGSTGSTGLTVTGTDTEGDDITYKVSDARFEVVDGKLTVVSGTILDFEKESSISVGLTANDGDLDSEEKTANVSVTNVDDIPLTLNIFGTRGSINEGDIGGTGVTFMADDNDGLDNLVFSSSVEGFDVIDLGGGRYELEVTQALDREAQEEVKVVVTATDESGSMMTPTITISVGGKDDTSPMLGMEGMGKIAENMTGDTAVFFRPTDADGDTMFTFYVEGENRKHFKVVPAGFNLYALQVADDFDYEMSGKTVSVTVTVADSAGMHDSATFDVAVTDANDNPPMITTMGEAAIDEEMAGSTGLTVAATDKDSVGDLVTWSVDDTRFSIGAAGALSLKEGEELDYDGDDGTKSVTVKVTANDGANNSAPHAITVTINPTNDNRPVITVDADGKMPIPEGMIDANMTDTGVDVSVADGDGDDVSAMVSGDDRFEIDADGNLVIKSGKTFDYETAADRSIELTITANDGVNDATSQTVDVMITDVNDSAPVLTVTDNKGGQAVFVVTRDEGQVSVDTTTDHKIAVSDADSHELPSATVSDDRFYIDANGYLLIRGGEDFDHEADGGSTISLTITADDGKNAAATQTITFHIANVDEAPEITGERNPTLVMGPYGGGKDKVTVLTAVDPDNPDDPLPDVTWTDTRNPDDKVWEWSEDKELSGTYELGMKTGTFLGHGGPGATAPDDYKGYTADDAGPLSPPHFVDADDAELDERAVVRVTQTRPTITTSEHLATYRTFTVQPSKEHKDLGTIGEKAKGKPGAENFIPTFDELTGNSAKRTSQPVRLLTDAEIDDGINGKRVMSSTSRLGGTKYANRAAAAALQNLTQTNLSTYYDVDEVTPTNPVPVEPSALDIVTDTRAVDITTGAIKAGRELAIRYRWNPSEIDGDGKDLLNTDYNVDVALIDGEGSSVREEYRGKAAYIDDNPISEIMVNTSAPPTTLGTIEVDVTKIKELEYAKFGLWSYNNIRGCGTACPDEGLRGATAFGLRARAGDLATQDHVGVWKGQTVAFWGDKKDDGSIKLTSDGKGLALMGISGHAEIAVNFNNRKVQAIMDLGVKWYKFDFVGTLNSDRLGYTASIDTTVPKDTGAITKGEDVQSIKVLSQDSIGNVHAKGSLEGIFYGPQDAAGSSVTNAKASAETAGTWQVTDVPHVANPDDASTVVIGAFGAKLDRNSRLVIENADYPMIKDNPSN